MARPLLVRDVDPKDQSPDPDKVPTRVGKNKSGKTENKGGKTGKNKSGKTENKGSKTGKDKADNDEGPAGSRTLNPFE